MPEALPELVWFALLLFCFAFVWAARKLLAAMFNPLISAVSHIPFTGSALSDLLHSIESDVDTALGGVEHNIDALMGASWHRFAELNEWLWKELKRHTAEGALAAWLIRELTHAFESIRGLAHRAVKVAEAIPRDIRRLDREYRGIEHQVKTLERDFARGIGDDVLPRLKSLDKEVTHIIHSTIPAIRAAEADADRAISDLYSWAKGRASLLGVGTFSLAVATALTALGLDWLRCNENPFRNNKNACGLWSILAKVLGLAGLLAVGFTFQEFVDAADEVASGIGTFVGDLEAPFVAPLPPLPPPQG